MSDKKMLNETTIRKMMKLANLPSLTDKFIKENYFDYPQVTEQEEELDVEVEDEAPMDVPMDEPEMDLDVDMDEPGDGDLPAAEELVQDLMGVLEKHFEEVEFNVEVEGDDEPMDEPMDDLAMDPEPEMDLDVDVDDAGGEMDVDVDVDEEEPVLEEVPGNLADLGAMAAGEEAEQKADADMMGEETLEEEELEEMEDDGAHSKLIDAIAAKVAERLLAEAKKTNK